MAHPIDAEHDHEGGPGAVVSLRPQATQPTSRTRPASQPLPIDSAQEAPQPGGKRLWDKNNFGFWLAVCIAISLVFSIVYHALA
ncbi:MAG TPA: hypothetical protein VGU65_14415 [Frateuria sp.]|uniref:hypothetical protein n=1 Tax=Frateuria sp. TaxID=2211372 RepID=UPI002DF2FBC4|nr:hypothetical protein [Frateuria sp.]